ncbi:MAG: hypothetical protein ABSD38_11720 [Syntrophorhabdales bacterium]|jgi:hypothetical protein
MMNKARDNAHPVRPPRAKPSFLGMDRIIESISSTLTKAGARDVEATVSDGTVQLAVDGAEMNEAFETFGHAVAEGAAVTIHGGLVGSRTGEKEERKGCALLALSIRGGHEGMGLKKGLRAVRRIIRRQRGALDARQGPGETRINLYLPVLRSF